MLRPLLMLVPACVLLATACGGSDTEFSSSGGATSAGTSSTGGSSEANGGVAGASAGKPGSAGSVTNVGGATATGGTPEAGSAGSPMAGSQAADGGATTGAAGGSDAGTGGEAPSNAACPNIFGDYTIKSSEGTCGTLNEDAPQAIKGTDVACFAHFVSEGPAGPQAVNGGAALDVNGGFTAAMLYLDNIKRNPCSGIWNSAARSMTVKCGGAGDLCTIVLERKK